VANPEEITKLFGIEYTIIQSGIIWCSGWELCTAVNYAGGLAEMKKLKQYK
jgi:enoyl-[acyl-carrier protein] reductase II